MASPHRPTFVSLGNHLAILLLDILLEDWVCQRARYTGIPILRAIQRVSTVPTAPMWLMFHSPHHLRTFRRFHADDDHGMPLRACLIPQRRHHPVACHEAKLRHLGPTQVPKCVQPRPTRRSEKETTYGFSRFAFVEAALARHDACSFGGSFLNSSHRTWMRSRSS